MGEYLGENLVICPPFRTKGEREEVFNLPSHDFLLHSTLWDTFSTNYSLSLSEFFPKSLTEFSILLIPCYFPPLSWGDRVDLVLTSSPSGKKEPVDGRTVEVEERKKERTRNIVSLFEVIHPLSLNSHSIVSFSLFLSSSLSLSVSSFLTTNDSLIPLEIHEMFENDRRWKTKIVNIGTQRKMSFVINIILSLG